MFDRTLKEGAVTTYLDHAAVDDDADTVRDAPLIVGVGGTLRAGSSTERLLHACLQAAKQRGCRTILLSGDALDLPHYNPEDSARSAKAIRLIDALRKADGVVVGSPGYHGGISGIIKNSLDYTEDMRNDARPYLQDIAFGAITCANGWQAAVGTLGQLRTIGHALRAWPTPLGIALNAAERIWDDTALPVDGVLGQIQTMAAQMVTFANVRRATR